MALKQATKTKAKLRLALEGTAGSGKTFTGLRVATGLGGQKVALLDSEHGSAAKYGSGKPFTFLTDDEFPDYAIETYIRKINECAAAGVDVLMIDSLSHAWAGKGGALEQVDRLGAVSRGGKFQGGWAAVTPLQTRLVETILSYPGHVIATMRTKMEYAVETRGEKTVVKKLGMAPVQREGVDYEFDVIVDLDTDGNMVVTKTRCPELKGAVLKYEDTPKLVATLKAWLDDGAPAPAYVAPPPAGETPFQRLERVMAAKHIAKGQYLQALKAKITPRSKPSEVRDEDVDAVIASFPEPPPKDAPAEGDLFTESAA